MQVFSHSKPTRLPASRKTLPHATRHGSRPFSNFHHSHRPRSTTGSPCSSRKAHAATQRLTFHFCSAERCQQRFYSPATCRNTSSKDSTRIEYCISSNHLQRCGGKRGRGRRRGRYLQQRVPTHKIGGGAAAALFLASSRPQENRRS